MIRSFSRAALAAATVAFLAAPAFAQDTHSLADPTEAHSSDAVHIGDLELSGAFTRATLPSQPAGGGYLVITNNGETDDRLIGGAAAFADEVQVHEMAVVNDVMNMRELTDGLVIPAGETVTLQPGRYHLMFLGIQTPLVEGEHVSVTLEFEHAGAVDLDFAIAAAGARGAPDHGETWGHGASHSHH